MKGQTVQSANTIISLFPENGAVNINPDTHLEIVFSSQALLSTHGEIRIYDASNDSLVDRLDMSIPPGPKNTRTPSPYDTLTYENIPNVVYTVYVPDTDTTHVYQLNQIGGMSKADAFHFFPVLLTDSLATIIPHNYHLEYDKTYYVEVDADVFPIADGSFQGINGKNTWTFTTKATPPSQDETEYTIASDGSGDFNTIQGAIDFVPESNTAHKTFFIKNGMYNEIIFFRDKQNFTLFGESRESVIISYANNGVFNYRNMSPDPEIVSEYHYNRAVFATYGSSDFNLINFTIESWGEEPAQAEGLLVQGQRVQVHNVTILGSGDALQASGSMYMSESSLRGYGDNVLGYGAVFFNYTDFISTYGPHMWVRNTDANHGNVLRHCRLWTEGDVETDFARAPTNHGIDYPYAEAVILNCELKGVRARGWGDVGPQRENLHYWEFNSVNLEDGQPVDVSQRASYSRQLTMETDSAIIADYNRPEYVLNGWKPLQEPVILSKPDTIRTVENSRIRIQVRIAAAPYARYNWYKDGQLLDGQTGPFVQYDAVGKWDEGEYSVSVKNELGYDSAFVAVLAVDTLASSISQHRTVDISILNIFPNPADREIHIEYADTDGGNITGSIIDLSGKMVGRPVIQNSIIGRNILILDVSKLSTGIYLCRVQNDCLEQQHRIFIVK